MNQLPQQTTSQPTRQHPRVAADFAVRLFDGSSSVLARARDLSMAGLSVHDPAGMIGLRIDRVSLHIPGEPWELVLRVRLTRRVGETVAVAFSDIDWDDMFTLARYLSPRL
ncbi:MAG: PilZ domain-containing protein [Deltaproteobacteria bacterium]|nr:PilZ domain-containing protein [Deltaproteobacteria bacterium]